MNNLINYQKYKDYFNKISVFINPCTANYWNTITTCQINSKPIKLGKYYLNFISKYSYPGEFDKNGVPLYRHKDSQPFYHPIVISQYALGIYEMFLSADKKNKNKYLTEFLIQADWLIKNFENNKMGSGWYVQYDIPDYNLISPWISAMAQGEAISILTRAHQLNPNPEYLNIAIKALDSFNVDVGDGGLQRKFKSYPLYEEYPSPLRPVGVLNGFIFSLFGLSDLYLYTKNEIAKELFNQGVSSLRNIIVEYDLGYWSQYYLFDYPNSYPASYTYHILAAEQLKALYFVTDEDVFKHYSERWIKQSENFFDKLRALINKIMWAKKLNWSVIDQK